MIETKSNNGALVTFTALRYTSESLGGATSKNFVYEITESIPEDAKNSAGQTYQEATDKTGPFAKDGITYDGKTVTATVTVTKSGDSLTTSVSYSNNEKTFVNTYNASGSAVIEATKTLEGKALKSRQFSFTLTGDTITGSQTKQNGDGDNVGRIVFDTIEYTLADLNNAKSKDFSYTIKEVLTDKISGVVYDEHEETVTVTVTDQGNGTLKTEVHYDTDGASFVNKYETKPVDVSISGQKELIGDTLKANQFSFALTKVSAKNAAGDNILDSNADQTQYNMADGTITFDSLHYEKPGIYTYQIRKHLSVAAA